MRKDEGLIHDGTLYDRNQPQLWAELPYRIQAQTQWTDKKTYRSVAGWWNSAQKERDLLILNSKYAPYTHFLTLSFLDYLEPEQLKGVWGKIARYLRTQKAACYWWLEITRQNRWHYHLLFTTTHEPEQLKAGLKQVIGELRTTIAIRDSYNTEGVAGYIVKAKTQGTTKDGRYTRDLSAYNRVGFAPGVLLNRVGAIGSFWAKKKSELLRLVRERKARHHFVEAHGQEVANYMDEQFAELAGLDLSGCELFACDCW